MGERTEWGVKIPALAEITPYISPAASRKHAEAVAATANQIRNDNGWPATAHVVRRTVTTSRWERPGAPKPPPVPDSQASLFGDQAVSCA